MTTKISALEKFMAPPQNAGANDPKPQPIFAGFQKPSFDIQSVRDGRRSTLMMVDIPLDSVFGISSGNPIILPISGNTLYLDQDVSIVGEGIIHFQDTALTSQTVPMFANAGFIARIPFTQLLIENKTAQTGKVLRIFYGIDVDFATGVNPSLSITNQSAISAGNSSGILTASSTPTQAYAANTSRKYLWLQNRDTTRNLLVGFKSGATPPNISDMFAVKADGGVFVMDSNINTEKCWIACSSGGTNSSVIGMEG